MIEKNIKKEYIFMYNWVNFAVQQKLGNIVNQPYFNKKKF